MGVDDKVAVYCPHCEKKLFASQHALGTIVGCPGCHKRLWVPTAGTGGASKRVGYRVVNLEEVRPAAALLKGLPANIAQHDRILPLTLEGDTLTIAAAEPPSPEEVDRLRFLLGHSISVAIASASQLAAAIHRYYPSAAPEPAPASSAAAADSGVNLVPVEPGAEEPEAQDDALQPDGQPIGLAVQQIIGDAIRWGADRVLLWPLEDRVKVAFRIYNVVHHRDDLLQEAFYPVLVRLMAMVNLQGVIKLFVGENERKLRVGFKSSQHGVAALLEIPQDGHVVEACKAVAAKLGYPYVALDAVKISKAVIQAVPEAVARQNRILPVAIEGETLKIAMCDPRAAETIDQLRFICNRPITPAMAPEGAILAAIDRYYAAVDTELDEVLNWELSQTPDLAAAAAPADAGRLARLLAEMPQNPAGAIVAHLRMLYRGKMFGLFENARAAAKVCRQVPPSGALEVMFPQSHLLPTLPPDARRYIEDKIWAIREAVVSRLEQFLEKDALARGLAMTYSQYLACCDLAEGQPASIDPAAGSDAAINFLYWLAMQSFPSIESNGNMLSFVTEHLEQFSRKIAAIMADPHLVVDPGQVRTWLARYQGQTITDEVLDCDSPPIARLLELIVAEALHARASRIVLLPRSDRLEIAFRVQKSVYPRDGLPLRFLYPLLARLAKLAGAGGQWTSAQGEGPRNLRVRFRPEDQGLGALITIDPDPAAVERCREQAEQAGQETVKLDDLDVAAPLLALIPKSVAWKKVALPVGIHGNTVSVAVAEPPDPRRMDELRLVFNRSIAVVMAPADEILAAIYRSYRPLINPQSVSPVARAILMEEASAAAPPAPHARAVAAT